MMIFLNIVLTPYCLNHLSRYYWDSGSCFCNSLFFLVTSYLCFNLCIKKPIRQRSNPEKIETQSHS